MASTVHYKFKSQKDYDSIEFDGMFISVGDLKRQIVDKRGLGRDQAMELQLTNAQTNEDYEDDAVLVWKNTSVIAKRVPRDQLAAVGSEVGSTTVKKTVYVPPPQIPAGTEFRKPPPRRNMTYIAPGAAGADGAPADTSADPSIAALVSGAASAWETEKAAASAMGRGAGRGGGRGAPGGGRGMGGRGRGMDTSGPPPAGYVCFRCSVPGHWIHQCPTNGDQNLDVVRMKTAYGIPQNRLEHTEDGVLVAPTGESTSFKADDDEFSRMMGFLTEREEAKAGTALPAPGDGEGQGDAAALPAPGDEGKGEEAADDEGKGEETAEDGAGAEDGANAEDGEGKGAGGENFQPPLPPGPPPPGAQQATANGVPGMMNPMMGMGGMGGMGMNPMMGMGMGMGMGMNPMMMNPMMGMMGMPGMDIMMNPMAGLAGGRGGMGGRGSRGGRGIVAAPSGRGPGTAKGKPIKVVVRKKGVGPTGSAPRDSPGDRREDDEAEKRSGDENEDKDTAREGDDEGGADGDGDKKIDDSPPEKREVRRVVIKRDRDRNVRERSPEPSGPRRVVVVRKRARSPERAQSPDRSREGSPDGDEGGGSGKKKRRNRGGKRRGGKGKGGGGGGGGGGGSGVLSRLGK